jgi:predicted PurR-regulated permease PerM
MALTDRQRVLGGLFVVVGVVTLAILSRVLQTVFFSITVAYVLYPVRRELVNRGAPRRVAAGAATVVGFVFVVLLVTPIVYALYARQAEIIDFLRDVPDTQPITAFGMTFVVDVSDLLERTQTAVSDAAIGLATAAPVVALKAFLFVFLVYALLLRPENAQSAAMRLIPGEYHDVAMGLHRQVRDTLFALYVLQAATAFGTFAVALVVFWALGYEAAFSLAVFSGVLQFIPVLGPSLLILAIAMVEVFAGQIGAAILVTAVGLVFVGFLPDAIIRPQLASITTGMPASLYFVGFTGGTLSLGVVGVIAGPLAIALLVEVVELITDERVSIQQTFQESATEAAGDDD